MQASPFQLTLLAAAMGSVIHLPVSAQSSQPVKPATAAPKAEVPLQKVVVKASTDSYNPRRDDTATKIVVSREEILKYGDTNVFDVFKRLPGVTVSGNGGRGSAIRMRGLGGGYTQILVDGDRPPPGFSLDDLPPDAIERIEIVRAATAEFSTQSVAGTINIVLKRAVRTAQRELKLGVSHSSTSGFVPNASILVSDRKGALGYSVNVNAGRFQDEITTWGTEQGYDRTGRQVLARENTDSFHFLHEHVSVSPRLTYTLSNGDTLSAQFGVSRNRGGGGNLSVTRTDIGAAPLYPYSRSDRDNSGTSGNGELAWVMKLQGGAKLDIKAAGNRWRNTSRWGRVAAASATATGLADDQHSSGVMHGYSYKGKYTAPIAAGHSLSAGWDTSVAHNRNEQFQRLVITDGPQLPFNPYESNEGKVARAAAFAQDEWNVTPGWSVYAGLRWEGIDTQVDGNTFAASRSHSSVWSPLFQTLYKLPSTKGDQLRFALTRTYKAPSVGELTPRRYLSANNSQFSPDRVGNPRLGPETAIGFDASYEHYWAEGALFSISASAREIDGYIRSGLSQEAGLRWVTMPVNQGKAQSRGLDVELKFPLKALMANAPEIDLRANLSRNWSRVDGVTGSDNRLGQQTPLSGAAGIDYKKGALTTGASVAYRQSTRTRSSNRELSVDPSSLTADAYLLWKFTPKLSARLAVGNLLAKDDGSVSEFQTDEELVRRSYRGRAVTNVRAGLEMKF